MKTQITNNPGADKVLTLDQDPELKSKEVQDAIAEATGMLKAPPTEAQVIEWFKSDLHAAVYSLTALISMPSVVEDIAKRFYQETQKPRTMPTEEKPNLVKNGR